MESISVKVVYAPDGGLAVDKIEVTRFRSPSVPVLGTFLKISRDSLPTQLRPERESIRYKIYKVVDVEFSLTPRDAQYSDLHQVTVFIK